LNAGVEGRIAGSSPAAAPAYLVFSQRLTGVRSRAQDDVMPDHLTLDVVDRPAGGVLRAIRTLRRLGDQGAPGLRVLLQFGTSHFSPRPFPALTPRRIGAIAVWESADAVATWERALSPLCAGAREHWHVEGELVRAAFSEPWRGWEPDTDSAQPLADDEPALILISGQLRARIIPAFSRDAGLAVRHAFAQPGYLGGLGITNTPLNTTSCSAWRTYADARAYAFQPGGHAEAMKRDRAAEHHRTEWFLRVRPLVEQGSLAGRAPFGEVLRPVIAA
jgi:hypothetical protein